MQGLQYYRYRDPTPAAKAFQEGFDYMTMGALAGSESLE